MTRPSLVEMVATTQSAIDNLITATARLNHAQQMMMTAAKDESLCASLLADIQAQVENELGAAVAACGHAQQTFSSQVHAARSPASDACHLTSLDNVNNARAFAAETERNGTSVRGVVAVQSPSSSEAADVLLRDRSLSGEGLEAQATAGARVDVAGACLAASTGAASCFDASVTPPRERERLDSAKACRPRFKLVPSLRVSVYPWLPDTPGKKGLAAIASLESSEDGSLPRLRFRQGLTTLGSVVLDERSITLSPVAGPCVNAQGVAHASRRGGVSVPRSAQWLKVSCVQGIDIYVFADRGWQVLLPHLYA